MMEIGVRTVKIMHHANANANSSCKREVRIGLSRVRYRPACVQYEYLSRRVELYVWGVA